MMVMPMYNLYTVVVVKQIPKGILSFQGHRNLASADCNMLITYFTCFFFCRKMISFTVENLVTHFGQLHILANSPTVLSNFRP